MPYSCMNEKQDGGWLPFDRHTYIHPCQFKLLPLLITVALINVSHCAALDEEVDTQSRTDHQLFPCTLSHLGSIPVDVTRQRGHRLHRSLTNAWVIVVTYKQTKTIQHKHRCCTQVHWLPEKKWQLTDTKRSYDIIPYTKQNQLKVPIDWETLHKMLTNEKNEW